jgi:O-antigen ligase
MKGRPEYRTLSYLFCLLYIIGFYFFYYKYVPLVKSFQAALIPILFIVFVLTLWREEWGIVFFVFFFPLINNLPYFFGIYEDTPQAPTALVLFLAFFMGWLIRRAFLASRLHADRPIFKPLLLVSLIIVVSGIVTFFRYTNFYPFKTGGIHELVVNVNGIRAGGALMSDLFGCLNYLTGFLFFFVVWNALKDRGFARKLLYVFSISIFLSLIFSLFQIFYSIDIGNSPAWVYLGGITSTFKDTNSFGAVLSSSLPLFLGLFLSSSKRGKVFFFILFVLGLSIFPAIGSRSGLLALGISAIFFFLLFLFKADLDFRKKIIVSISSFIILLVLAFSYFVFLKESRLYKRIDSDIDVIVERKPAEEVFTLRLEYWKAASLMISDYPITGVGMGAYIIELPNYMEAMGLPYSHTDSAENYLFQVSSELGLVGLLLVLWLFFEIIRQMIRGSRASGSSGKERYLYFGVISALIAMFVNFIFHSYIGAFDVKYFFWFLVFLAFTFNGREVRKRSSEGKISKKFLALAVLLAVVFGAVYLWNSTHSLSLEHRRSIFGWKQNFGLYDVERDDRGNSFRWTKKRAGIELKKLGDDIVIPVMASHPDINENPVTARIFLADSSFRKQRLIKEISLDNAEWRRIEYSLADHGGSVIFLLFETDRTWQPLKYTGAPDPRNLGLRLGRIWFEYPVDLPREKIEHVETISSENWEGKQKASLLSDGSSEIRFDVDRKNVALRLTLRGQKAFGSGPFLIVRLNGDVIGKTVLEKEEWTSLVFFPGGYEAENVLSVEFTNDIYDAGLGQDRNLFLGSLDVIYMK